MTIQTYGGSNTPSMRKPCITKEEEEEEESPANAAIYLFSFLVATPVGLPSSLIAASCGSCAHIYCGMRLKQTKLLAVRWIHVMF